MHQEWKKGKLANITISKCKKSFELWFLNAVPVFSMACHTIWQTFLVSEHTISEHANTYVVPNILLFPKQVFIRDIAEK